jgi:hypothetical protein
MKAKAKICQKTLLLQRSCESTYSKDQLHHESEQPILCFVVTELIGRRLSDMDDTDNCKYGTDGAYDISTAVTAATTTATTTTTAATTTTTATNTTAAAAAAAAVATITILLHWPHGPCRTLASSRVSFQASTSLAIFSQP